ncbi:MAG: hypothetical protein K6E85_07090 [Lachnospiraceae bacterium]|nr:hypothetical protein [Lachnospiraceae bacterium]
MGKKIAQGFGVGIMIIGIIMAVILVIGLSGNKSTSNAPTPNLNPQSVTNVLQVTQGTTKINDTTPTPESKEIDDDDIVLVDDDYIKAVYEKRFDNEYLEEVGYLMIKVTNKSDQKVCVYMANGSVNDEMLSPLSGGGWIDIEPQKSLRSTINIFFTTLDSKSVTDIKTTKFDFRVTDEHMHDIETVENIQIDF